MGVGRDRHSMNKLSESSHPTRTGVTRGLVLSAVPGARGRGKPRVRTGGAAAGPRDIETTSPRRGSPADRVQGSPRGRSGWRSAPEEGALVWQPPCRRPSTAHDPGERVSRRRLEPGSRVCAPTGPVAWTTGPVVGGHASQGQVKGGCRHGQAWVMDRGRCGPDPGERVSVEGGALEPGSGRCTVDPGAQMDKDEHNRGGARTLRLTSRVACGQVHRVWITGSSGSRSHLVTAAPGGSAPPRSGPPLGPVPAVRAQSPHRARRYMHRRGPVLGHCRPGPPRVTPASAHCPPRGSPHVSQRERPGRRCRC